MIHKLWLYVVKNKYLITGLFICLIWSVPMLLTRGLTAYGDFTYFAQIYEAIRLNVVEYHQFPWWNPWIGGGVPLYGNPQAGVFSLTTLLSFVFTPVVSLKITIAFFYIFGYYSFYKLALYLRITESLSFLLGLIWVFSGFFAAHLPTHFTFIWLLVLPWFILWTLRLNSIKAGLVLGISMSLLILGQMHYSFIIIGLTVSVMYLFRFFSEERIRRLALIKHGLIALLVTIIFAGHRIIVTLFSKADFANVNDITSGISSSILSFLVPFSYEHNFIQVTHSPVYGWAEQTAYSSIFVIMSLAMIFLYIIYTRHHRITFTIGRCAGLILVLMITTFLIGLGDKGALSPYHLLKMLPVLDSMRVSSRWFILTTLAILLFIGVIGSRRSIGNYVRFSIHVLCGLAVLELFLLNFGYHTKLMTHPVARPDVKTSTLTFQQHIRFGESTTSPDGYAIPSTDRQYLYREYESTLFNIGTILANEAHVDIYNNATPKCSYVSGCGLVMSKNAEVIYWSPHKIILHRTGAGEIIMNTNTSSYVVINNVRVNNKSAIDRFSKFVINDPSQEIVIEYKPVYK